MTERHDQKKLEEEKVHFNLDFSGHILSRWNGGTVTQGGNMDKGTEAEDNFIQVDKTYLE